MASLAAMLVFGLWYPYPYREISGGRELFVLMVAVDIIIGPLITLAIFDRRKPRMELRRDMLLVAVLQLAALGYGLWTVAIARPVHMVFEIDRFRIVHAIEIPDDLLKKNSSGIDAMPFTGPTFLGLRAFRDNKERADATLAALQGVHLGSRPDLWQSYDSSRQDVLNAAKPVKQLQERFPEHIGAINAAISSGSLSVDFAKYLPLVGRKSFWTVFVDGRNGDVVAFLPLDSF